MSGFFDYIITGIGSIYKDSNQLYNVLRTIMSAIIIYKTFFWLIGMFFTREFPKAKNKHKYAILIAARNEEKVIGNLLDSIKKQDYPNDLLTVFVVCDNCTDDTYKVASSKGAICYERFDNEHKTKGFALQFLFNNIKKDYGIESFEGYFIFDADNLLQTDYISRMNDSFDAGEKIITSYRNTKNFDENWVASTYAIHWLRSIRANHRARSILRLATNIQGTGFLFTNEIVRDGWKYTSLTEDRALTADVVKEGYQITYNDKAMFYDEQPTSLKVALRQRLRWSKGHLMAFAESGPGLFLNIFCGKLFLKTERKKAFKKQSGIKGVFLSIIESIRHRFASYDTFIQLLPTSVINLGLWLIFGVIIYSCYCYSNGFTNINFFRGGTLLAQLLRNIFDIKISVPSGVNALLLSGLLMIWLRLFYRIGKYIENIWIAIYVFIVENKRIKKIPFRKKVLYTFTWPIFDIIGRYTTYIALFKKIEWKPIPHDSKVTIDDINGGNDEK